MARRKGGVHETKLKLKACHRRSCSLDALNHLCSNLLVFRKTISSSGVKYALLGMLASKGTHFAIWAFVYSPCRDAD